MEIQVQSFSFTKCNNFIWPLQHCGVVTEAVLAYYFQTQYSVLERLDLGPDCQLADAARWPQGTLNKETGTYSINLYKRHISQISQKLKMLKARTFQCYPWIFLSTTFESSKKVTLRLNFKLDFSLTFRHDSRAKKTSHS